MRITSGQREAFVECAEPNSKTGFGQSNAYHSYIKSINLWKHSMLTSSVFRGYAVISFDVLMR